MHCEGKLKLRPYNKNYGLIEAVTKAGWTIQLNMSYVTFQGNSVIWSHETDCYLIDMKGNVKGNKN
jgi:hypothetical protein